MAYTLGQAAKTIGKSKTAVAHAISSGRLSATKDAFNRWVIDPAELFRVYPQNSKNLAVSGDVVHQVDNITPETERLKATVEGLEKLCRQIENERDNLRAELVHANEERRTVLRQLTALLTDQRAVKAPDVITMPSPPHVSPTPTTTEKPRRWWSFGKRESA
jgi:hypothetical protein